MTDTTSCATPKNSPQLFGPADMALIIQHMEAARVILRTVALAVDAQIDGSIQYEDNHTERWQPSIDAAGAKLMVVRDVLLGNVQAPPADWWTPLNLLEAIGAALWHGNVCTRAEALDEIELGRVTQVGIELLDSMIESFEIKGVSHV